MMEGKNYLRSFFITRGKKLQLINFRRQRFVKCGGEPFHLITSLRQSVLKGEGIRST